MSPPDGLNTRQWKFARAYFRTGDAIKAHRLAGYKAKTKATARGNAYKLLYSEAIQNALKELRRQLDDRLAHEMVREWQRTRATRQAIAYSDMGDVLDFTADGAPKLKPANQIPKRALKAMRKAEVEVDPEGNTKRFRFELAPKEPHLEALEEKFSVLPDNQRPAQKFDITSGGKPLPETVDGRRDAILAWLAVVESRGLDAPNLLPAPKEAPLEPTEGGTP
jgi:phage terminase small subunit